MPPGDPGRELDKHIRPPAGAEVQQPPHVLDQLLLGGVPWRNRIQQLRSLREPLRFGESGRVAGSQRLHTGDRQLQEHAVGDLRAELELAQAEAPDLPAERLDGLPGAGEDFDGLVTGQQPCQPSVTHVLVEPGGRREHPQGHLRVVAGLKPVDRNTRCKKAGDHRVAGIRRGGLRSGHLLIVRLRRRPLVAQLLRQPEPRCPHRWPTCGSAWVAAAVTSAPGGWRPPRRADAR